MVARPVLDRAGKTATPLEPLMGYYQDGWVASRLIHNPPLAFVTQGRYNIRAEGTSQIVLGDAVLPIIGGDVSPDVPAMVEVRNLVREWIPKNLRVEKDSEENTTFHAKAPSEAEVKQEGVLLARNTSHLHIAWDEEWFANFINDLQKKVTNLVRSGGIPYPRLKVYGWGLFDVDKDKLGLSLDNRPVDTFRFGGEHIAQWQLEEDTFTKTQLIQDAFYKELWAYELRKFITGDVEGKLPGVYQDDWMAWSDAILRQFKTPADINIPVKWSGDDIVDQVWKFVGVGWTQANPWPILTSGDLQAFLELCIVLGFVQSRASPHIAMAKLYREKGFFSTAVDYLGRYSKPELEGVGSLSTPFMPWRFNSMSNPNGKPDVKHFPLPSIMVTPEKATEYGKMVRHTPRMNEKRVRVDIKNGEIDSPYTEPDLAEEVTILPVNHNDVRIRTIVSPYQIRSIRRFDLPIFLRTADNLVPGARSLEDEDERRARRLLHIINLMSNTPTLLADGYNLAPGMIISMASTPTYGYSSIDYSKMANGRRESTLGPQLTEGAAKEFRQMPAKDLKAGSETGLKSDKLEESVGSAKSTEAADKAEKKEEGGR